MSVDTGTLKPDESASGPVTKALIVVALIGLTAAVYARVTEFAFVNFDDDAHVYANPFVTCGLTRESLAWAFGIHGPSQWHPLAWISHQIDCELFGLRPGGHHLTNVVLHAGSASLLFLFLFMITQATWRSAFVAAVFAVHPLNVESVAWISERRNVLSLFLGLLTMIVWVRYVRRGGALRYGLAVTCYCLALMAKPLVVTLPCMLLLLDYWPLRRMTRNETAPGTRTLILEKLPLFALSAVASVLTVLCQQHALASADELPLRLRLLNSLAAYGTYLRRFVWPHDLGAFYPHPGFVVGDPFQELATPAILGAVLLAIVTAAALLTWRRHPYFVMGWLWFLGTLVPMIGVWQVGRQQMADRYMYLPIIGLLIAVAWLVPSALRPAWRSLMTVAGVLLIFILGLTAWHQVDSWRDSVTLFERALAVARPNSWAHNNLGLALHERGESHSAIVHLSEAVRLDPEYALARYNLGVVLHNAGRPDLAVPQLGEALRLAPDDFKIHSRLGASLAELGHLDEAIENFEAAVAIAPESPEAQLNLGIALSLRGDRRRSVAAFERVLQLDPANQRATFGLASDLFELGDLPEARRHFEDLIRTAPAFAPGHCGLGKVYLAQGERDRAIEQFREALRLDPGSHEARAALQDLTAP